jgi:peptidoglycan hydrolase-like protein with peptidoglycan-binding domain
MRLRKRFLLCISAVLVTVSAAPPAGAAGSSAVAALQVALRVRGLYSGSVDGMLGAATTDAVRALQERAGLPVDGIAGPATRAVLGARGRPALGARALEHGNVGWDVAELQFSLAWHGFPSGPLDGRYGPRTEAALVRFQRWAGLKANAALGAPTLSALRSPPATSPIALSWPLDGVVEDEFGPRGDRFHTGIDLPAPTGTPVGSAGAGLITYAGALAGGWGLVVTVAHGSGVRTMYAHLSRVDVKVGATVGPGTQIGLVGATGHASGPHLHFEVRLRGAAIDPRTALP